MSLAMLLIGLAVLGGAAGVILYSARKKTKTDSDIMLIEARILHCILDIENGGQS